MTTTVTIELSGRDVELLHRRSVPVPLTPTDLADVSRLSLRVLNDLVVALPDPDEALIEEMLKAYVDAADLDFLKSLEASNNLSPRMVAGMKAALAVVRERDASE